MVNVAAEDPDTAAKIVQPTMLVWSKPPGNQLIHGASPLNISWDKRVRNNISPIQINKGRAVKVQLEAPVQIVVIIASPAGRTVNNSMPTQATPMSASPIQTEPPSKVNKTNKNMPTA